MYPPRREESPLTPPPAPTSWKRAADDFSVDPKRSRPSEVCAMDHSFDASKFIGSNLLGPRAQEQLQDFIPMEKRNCRVAQLTGDLKSLSLQKGKAEEEKAEAVQVKLKAEGDLKFANARLKLFEEEKVAEVERLQIESAGLISEVERLRGQKES
ncbi:hypothetical protein PIB30_051131 [Stylosanthes scabra]|uniref:Uncharacterized protein n=1 Tax=Stylosanthes scabra TaxID=79078 RepID=A0ABU6XGC6_9FABA|nr:hypothetical protein [Stylosanthes scabra]